MWTNQARRMADRKAQFRAIAARDESDPEQRPTANGNEAWTHFRASFPDVADWLFNNSAKGNAFATSLYQQAVNRGSLSPRQMEVVRENIARAGQGGGQARGGLDVSKLFTVLQKHSKFYAGRLVITRKNGDTLCWVLWDDLCVGKLEDGKAVLFAKRAGDSLPEIRSLLEEFEENPLQAAMKYGKLSGVCCSCGREITADESLERGIGPICAQRFAL